MAIIQYLIRSNIFLGNTVVSFGGRDVNEKQFYINRYDRKPIFIDQTLDREFFSIVLTNVCSLILNSGQTL